MLLNFLKLSIKNARLTRSESTLSTTRISVAASILNESPTIVELIPLKTPEISRPPMISITIVMALSVKFLLKNGNATESVPRGSKNEKRGRTLTGILAIRSFVPTNEYLNRLSDSRSFAKRFQLRLRPAQGGFPNHSLRY